MALHLAWLQNHLNMKQLYYRCLHVVYIDQPVEGPQQKTLQLAQHFTAVEQEDTDN